MVDIQHKNITGADAAHPPFYASESDPTTTLGPYRVWFKPSTGEYWVRNAANTAWIDPVTAGGGAGGSSGHTIQDEGSNLTARANLNFAGAGVTVTDDAANDQTDVTIPGGTADPASETVAGLVELATQTEVNTGTDTARAVTPATLSGRSATETRSGLVEIATQGETNTGTDDTRTVTPAKLAGRTASTTQTGVVELATDAETQTGTDATRAVTPANLSARSATETRSGLVELATDAETQTGTDTARAITPANLSARSATETTSGIAEIATQTETDTGTDDNRIVTPLKAATRFLAKAGGTLTGFLTLHANPTSAMHAVTKQYADGLVVGGASPASETVAGIAEIATQVETDAGTDDTRIVTPLKLANYSGLGGGAGNIAGAYDIEAGSYTDAGMSDEFASGTLDAQWTTATSAGTIDFPGQPASACYDLTSRPGTLLLQPAYSTSAVRDVLLRQADGLTSGESLVLSCSLPFLGKYGGTTYSLISMYLNSSTTSQSTGNHDAIRLIVNDPATNTNQPSIQVLNQSSSLRALSTDWALSQRIYLRVSRKTINSVDSFVWMYSPDGVSWTQVWHNPASTYTQMWIWAGVSTQTNPSISPVFPINWIRHVASTAHDLW